MLAVLDSCPSKCLESTGLPLLISESYHNQLSADIKMKVFKDFVTFSVYLVSVISKKFVSKFLLLCCP